jgi:hypothetical protein
MPTTSSVALWAALILVTVLVAIAVIALRGRKRQVWWRGDQVTTEEVSEDRKLRLKLRQRHQFE